MILTLRLSHSLMMEPHSIESFNSMESYPLDITQFNFELTSHQDRPVDAPGRRVGDARSTIPRV